MYEYKAEYNFAWFLSLVLFCWFWIPILTFLSPLLIWIDHENRKIICERCGYPVKGWNSHVHCKNCSWTIFERREDL